MDNDPFYTRIGVCYTNANRTHPQNAKFNIERGYNSWGGNGTETINPKMRLYFNQLTNLYDRQTCQNFDYNTEADLDR